MASEINSNEVRASAFQSRLPISDCSLLVKCEDNISARSALSKSAMVSPSATSGNGLRVSVTASNNVMYNNNNNNNSTNNNGNNSSNSPKMGSRRIFTPQFKLQVLESYRNDSDCKGNQRATARKYNIHRRQIQKWLQCESNLRSSVANINQNNVKHQFHNISHHQQQAPSSVPRMQMQHPTTAASLSGGASNGYSHHSHHHHHAQALGLNSLNVPSMPSRLASSNSSSAPGVLAAANLAAAVAVAIASTSSTSTSTAAVSPLRPTAINGTAGGVNNGVAKISPSLLHSHHHHHFSMSPYTHSPVAAPVPVTVPMLTHHISAPPPPPQPHALHQHYPYHNLPTHSHTLHLSHQPSAFLPTACLPRVLSAVTGASATDIPKKEAEENYSDATIKDEQDTMILSTTTTSTITNAAQAAITTPSNVVLTRSMHGYIHDATDYECLYRNATYADDDSMRDAKCRAFLQNSSYQYREQDCTSTLMTVPIDLSLGSRRNRQENSESIVEAKNTVYQTNTDTNTDTDYTKCHLLENNNNTSTSSTQIVDLTFRKRKVITTNTPLNDTEHPQKLAKRLEENNADKISIGNSKGDDITKNVTAYNNTDDEDEEVEIEVDVEAKQLSSKPVKLFKPYLLDNDNDNDNEREQQSSQDNNNISNSMTNIDEQREPIIWTNHPAYDSSRASSIYSPSNEKHTFHGGSPYFHTSKPSSPQSVLSPAPATSISPTNFLRCPKGSPVSGYESSSSICSERDETCSLTESRSYSVDIQMHPVCENKLISHPIHIHEWLDQDTNNETNTPPLARSSIALYA